ncbi:MAG: glutamyl-tRNA reductase [Deltaproteobacteria bacterium]
MDIQVIGLNHKSAPIAVREKLSFPKDRLAEALSRLKGCACVEEDVILSTCNRTEIYAAVSGEQAVQSIKGFISGCSGVRIDEISSYLYSLSGREAVRHLLRVAASLDSMIVGETQIFGQVKDAYFAAREANVCGRNLNQLFEEAIKIGKRIRTETGIGKGAVSVSTAAIELSRKIFESLDGKKVLIIGAGKIGEMTVKNLYSRGVSTVVVANRTFEKARELAGVFGGSAIRFDQVHEALNSADIVISSTSAPHFVLTKDDIAAAMRARGSSPLFLIDLGLPRNIDPGANDVDNAYVYNIDDLAQVRDANIKDRMREAGKAERMIEVSLDTVLRKLDERMP